MKTMKKLSCDIETFSDVDLIRCGVYKYADSPNFEMLLFAYAVDDGDVHIIDIAGGEELPEKIIQAIKSDTVVKTAYNAQFERVCLSRYLKLPDGEYLNPQSWYWHSCAGCGTGTAFVTCRCRKCTRIREAEDD